MRERNMAKKNRIRELREKKGLSLQDLADKTNIKKSTLASYETRGVNPKYEKLATLANFFDVPKVYLLGNKMPTWDSSEPEVVDSLKLSDFLEEELTNTAENSSLRLADLDNLLAKDRYNKIFNEVSSYFTEEEFNILTDIIVAFPLLTMEDKKFFAESMGLKSGLLGKNYEIKNGKIILNDSQEKN